MDVLEAGPVERSMVRRCHVWCWSNDLLPAEWEQRTLVVGGLSFVGLMAGAMTASLSAGANRRRRRAAVETAGPGWRYVTTGSGQVTDGQLLIRDQRGAVLAFDLRSSGQLDSPGSGWLRFRATGSPTWWAVEVK